MSDPIDHLRQRVDKLEARVAALEGPLDQSPKQVRGRRPYALQEFKSKFQLKTHTDRAVMIAYYLEFYADKAHFTIHDVLEGYVTCRYQKPGNISDVLGRCAGKGLMMKIGEENQVIQWRLTETGVKFIEEMLKDDE